MNGSLLPAMSTDVRLERGNMFPPGLVLACTYSLLPISLRPPYLHSNPHSIQALLLPSVSLLCLCVHLEQGMGPCLSHKNDLANCSGDLNLSHPSTSG